MCQIRICSRINAGPKPNYKLQQICSGTLLMSSTSGTPAEQSGQERWLNDMNGQSGGWISKNRQKSLTDSFGPKESWE